MAIDTARAKSLFLAASDLSDPAERAAYLDRECGDDAELGVGSRRSCGPTSRAITTTGARDATIDSDAGPTSGGPHGHADAETRGRAVSGFDHVRFRAPPSELLIAGRYTLQQKIGEGGMGEVWVAKQTEPVKRKVALKLIKPGMDSRAVLPRFEQERQALAMMDHPNIAKVLDAGMTPPGSRSS